MPLIDLDALQVLDKAQGDWQTAEDFFERSAANSLTRLMPASRKYLEARSHGEGWYYWPSSLVQKMDTKSRQALKAYVQSRY